MNRETALLAAVAAVVVASVVFAAALPGVLADPRTESDERDPGRVNVEEVTITAGEVTGASATLSVDTYLAHRGGPVENVTVFLRATDANTGLVEATREVDAGTLEGEDETRVHGDLVVPRESDYRIETIVYVDGARIASTDQSVEGVGTLVPGYADTGVAFHRFGAGDANDLPSIEYGVADAADERATLEVTTYLTNSGDEAAEDLSLELKARQSDSNVVADVTTVEPGAVAPGATARPTAELTVPEGYDYYLDAVLWKGNTIVETTRSTANLGGGNLTVEAEEERRGIEVSDFETDGNDREFDDDASDERDDASGQPGFGVAVAAVALLSALVIAIRRTNHD